MFKNSNQILHKIIINIKVSLVFFIAIIMNIIGFIANQISPFPLYYYFSFIFTAIAFIAVFTVRYFAKEMDKIMVDVSSEPKFRIAKYNYLRFLDVKFYYFIPFSMIFLYAGTGIPMIQSFRLNCSMAYALSAFTITVYFSILAYIQYISLAVFIYQVKNSDEKYLDYMEQMPANTDTLYKLSYLIKVYRNSFFSMGTLYIIAFGLFTLSGAFGVLLDFSNMFLIIGWSVILIAIVIAFPVVSIFERSWMMEIVRKLKTESVMDIRKKYKQNNSDKLQASDLIIAIWQTPKYPIEESVSLLYATISATTNLFTILIYAKELFLA